MRFTTILAVLAAPLLAFAQNPNPFNIPADGLSAEAGDTLDLSWNPTTSGTVTLVLRSGSASNLDEGTVIAKSIANSGSYSWSVPTSITRGSDYAIEIVDDSDPTQTNYTPYFVIDSDNTVASTTPTVTLGASSTSLSQQSGSSSTTETGSTSASSGMSGSSGSSSMTNTGETTRTTGGASSTNPGASFQPTSASASSSSGNAAPRATAMAGMLGAVALGALAL